MAIQKALLLLSILVATTTPAAVLPKRQPIDMPPPTTSTTTTTAANDPNDPSDPSAAQGQTSAFQECLVKPPTEALISAAKQMQAAEATAEAISQAFGVATSMAQIITTTTFIPTFVHVVTSNNTVAGGNLADSQVVTAIDDINIAYRHTAFQFRLAGIDRTLNQSWASGVDDVLMKTHLRRGDYSTLNLYFIPNMVANGFSYFPEPVVATMPAPATSSSPPSHLSTTNSLTKYLTSSPIVLLDGCVLRADTYSNRQSAPHEIGHWFGLFHTFEGNRPCDPANDLVDDTPALVNSWSCDARDDSCPGLPGPDPVHNFMSYGNCRSEWTPGQRTRMLNMYKTFRA